MHGGLSAQIIVAPEGGFRVRIVGARCFFESQPTTREAAEKSRDRFLALIRRLRFEDIK